MSISDYDDLDRLEKVISESVGFDMDDFIDYLECDRAYQKGHY